MMQQQMNCCHRYQAILFLATVITACSAFAPIAQTTTTSVSFQQRQHQHSRLFAAASNSNNNHSPLDPLINQLPWNASRLKERQARQMRRQVAQLHRELGIPEDAPYEEVVAAADKAIVAAGRDVKKRLMVERNKDQILQLRLNERLAGLTSINMEARSQSTYEKDGPVKEKKSKKAVEKVSNSWRDGIVVKPDTKWRNRQVGIWGTMSVAGLLLPPLIGKMLMIQLMVVIGQLIWRGVPREDSGFNLFGGSDGGGSHKKVAWLLGASIFLGGKLVVFSLMPKVLRASKWVEIIGFTAENIVYMVANMYLQPYKGK